MPWTERHLALHLARRLLDKSAEDLVVLAPPASSGVPFDFVLIASGRNERMARSLVDEAAHFCKRHRVVQRGIEGDGGWMLLDCGPVVVHAFTEEKRAFYQLDELWPDAERLDVERELARLPDPDKDAR